MTSPIPVLLLLCLMSYALAFSIPIDNDLQESTHYQLPKNPDSHSSIHAGDLVRVLQRVRRQLHRLSPEGVGKPLCDKFGCQTTAKPKRQCGPGTRYDSRSRSCRAVRG